MHKAARFPAWVYYPNETRPPPWCGQFVNVVQAQQGSINSASANLTSDAVLACLRPGLVKLGYDVENKLASPPHIVRRPVLFGDQGQQRVAHEIDAMHDGLGIVVEIEAGRGATSNAVFRDLVRTSLISEARFLVLGVAGEYRYKSRARTVTQRTYRDAHDLLDAIFASRRLLLPFEGVLLFGY
jgi:hypothetical protein